MESKELIALAAKKSGLSEAEIRHNADVKRKEFQELISEQDACRMIVQELGVKLVEPEPALQWNTLAEIASRKVAEANVVARITHAYSPKSFEKERRKGVVCNLEIADATQKATLVLWDEDVWLSERNGWQRNDVLEMRRVQARNYNPLELHSSMLTEFVATGERTDFPQNAVPQTGFAALKEGTEADAVGRVTDVGELREFERNGRKGQVLNAALVDESGQSVRLVLWDYYAGYANKRLKVGDAVKLESVTAKKNGGWELHATWRSHLVIEPARQTLQTREALLEKTAPAATLAQLRRLPQKGRGLATLSLNGIVSAAMRGKDVWLEAEMADDSATANVSFEGREALQLLGLRHAPTIDLQLVLKLKEAHLKGRKLTVIIARRSPDSAELAAEHVVRILGR